MEEQSWKGPFMLLTSFAMNIGKRMRFNRYPKDRK